MAVRAIPKRGKKPGKPYVQRLPKARGSAQMPNPGQDVVTDPETRRMMLAPKRRAPRPRRHTKA